MLLLSCAAAQNPAAPATVQSVTVAREGADLRVEVTLSFSGDRLRSIPPPILTAFCSIFPARSATTKLRTSIAVVCVESALPSTAAALPSPASCSTWTAPMLTPAIGSQSRPPDRQPGRARAQLLLRSSRCRRLRRTWSGFSAASSGAASCRRRHTRAPAHASASAERPDFSSSFQFSCGGASS